MKLKINKPNIRFCVFAFIFFVYLNSSGNSGGGGGGDDHKAPQGPGGTPHEFVEYKEASVIQFDEFGGDVQIPKAIWKELGEISGKDAITFGEVRVRLKEKTPLTLIKPEIQFRFPKGGGSIDLSQYTRGNSNGTFLVFFEFAEIPTGERGKIFFIPQTKKRKIDGEIWGSGCNKYLDVKKFILDEGDKKGIEVNTTDSRHLAVLGGTFFIASGFTVSQVTFKDSKKDELFCPGFLNRNMRTE